MAPSPDPTTLADVILRSATEGYYPDSEEIAAANLTSVHLPTILKSLNAAKADIKVSEKTALKTWLSHCTEYGAM